MLVLRGFICLLRARIAHLSTFVHNPSIMIDSKRSEQILDILKAKNSVTVYDLATKLYTSESTIRRDLARMEQKGLVTRTFGGAILKSDSAIEDSSFLLREKQNIKEKRALAKEAVRFIEPNSALFLDSSSTCLQLVSMLSQFKNLLIITNGLIVANEIILRTKHDVILLGGKIKPSTNSVLGSSAEEMLRGYHASLCIMSTSGFDQEFGLSELTEEQARLKKIMIENSNVSIALVDQRKFGKKSLAHTCDIKDVSIVITNQSVPLSYKEAAPKTVFIEAKE